VGRVRVGPNRAIANVFAIDIEDDEALGSANVLGGTSLLAMDWTLRHYNADDANKHQDLSNIHYLTRRIEPKSLKVNRNRRGQPRRLLLWILDYFHIGGRSSSDLGISLKHMNQSRHLVPSLLSIRSWAVPQEPGGGTITSSPGCQSAGVAT